MNQPGTEAANPDLLSTARAVVAGGISIIPINAATKRPFFNLLPRNAEGKPTWEPFQSVIAAAGTLDRWLTPRLAAFAVVGGAVSGGLCILDFDVPRFYDAWRQKVGAAADGLPVQKTGGGGYQVGFRYPNPGGNDKLAWVPDESEDTGRTIAIETRGEGGYAVLAPSRHPSGNLYELIAGDFAAVPTLTQEQADKLLDAARSLDECPRTKQQVEQEAKPPVTRKYTSVNGQANVIDAFNQANGIRDVLADVGYTAGHGKMMVRPGGKSSSVTVRDGKSFHHSTDDRLCDGYWHTPFDVFCQYRHGGEVGAAVKDAAKQLGMSNGHPADYEEDFVGNAKQWVEYLARIRAAAPARDLPVIAVNNRQLRDVVADAIKSLSDANEPPFIFSSGGCPARLKRLDSGNLVIHPLTEPGLLGRMVRVADFVTVSKKGQAPATPCKDVVRDILAMDLHEHGNFPTLEAVTRIPVIRTDGTIFDTPGYDLATKLYYDPDPALTVPPIPTAPTADELRAAVDLIWEMIGEFPYESPADRANAFGTLLTPVIRQAIGGKSPLAIFDAPQAGTGKSLLAEAIGMVTCGESPPMMGAPSTEDEWRKQITSTLAPGPTLVTIDNLEGVLNSASLARALTASVWSDRMLTVSRQVNYVQRATWIGTGNNVELGGDLPRRCYRCRLDAKSSRPWKGRGFRHPNLLAWARETRGQLIGAMLTICRAWWVAGRPIPADAVTLGSFEAWSQAIAGILAHAGVAGFLTNLEDMYQEADEGGAQWEEFLHKWHEKYEEKFISLNSIAEDVQRMDGAALRESLPEGLGAFVIFVPGQYVGTYTVKEAGKFKIRLGKQLRQRVGRRYGDKGYYLKRQDDTHTKVSNWAVYFAGSEAVAGSQNSTPRTTPRTTNDSSCKYLDQNAGSAGSVSNLIHVRTHAPAPAHAHARTHAPAQVGTHPALPANDCNSSNNNYVSCGESNFTTPRTPPLPANDDDYETKEREAMQSEGDLPEFDPAEGMP